MENFNEVLKQYTEEVWKTVERYLPEEEGHQGTVLEAMNYLQIQSTYNNKRFTKIGRASCRERV